MITKQAEDFYHATTKDNFHKILESGKIESLHASSKKDPERTISVEPDRWHRNRTQLPAREACRELLSQGKNPDKVFLSKGGRVKDYGDYIVRKDLSSPKRSNLLNLVPSEHTTRRRLSVRNNADLIVPDEEIQEFRDKYPGLGRRFVSHSESNAPSLSKMQALPELPGRLLRSILSKEAAEEPLPLNPRDINRRAFLGGSTGIGIGVPGVKDLDFVVPYDSPRSMLKAKKHYLSKFPEMKESPFNGGRDNKQVLSGMIHGNDVDITLAHGDGPKKYMETVRAAKKKLSPEAREKIIAKKQKLKNSWLFGNKRYSRYKKKIDKKLGIGRF